MTTTITHILTHSGEFHADEVVATAMLRIAGIHAPVQRSREPAVVRAAQADPHTLVLDVGYAFEPALLNFDHHQDMALPASAGMVWAHFRDAICPDADAQLFFGQFIESIDAYDTNRNGIVERWKDLAEGQRNASEVIKGFNRDITQPDVQDAQFAQAVAVAERLVRNELYLAAEKAASERDYIRREVLPNGVAVFAQHSKVWKEKGEHLFAVMPHPEGWQIQSRDTRLAQIPEHISQCEGFVFRHATGFVAAVKDKSVAVAFAATLSINNL